MKFILTLEIPRILSIFNSVGMAHFGFIFLTADKTNEEITTHEYIHIKQQRELLILPWYVIYILHWLYNFLIKYKAPFKEFKKYFWQSYYDIVFEKEAFHYENDYDYLETRKPYDWLGFLKT